MQRSIRKEQEVALYNNGKWQYSPREELLTIEELEGKQNYKVREVIRKAIENEFPRITKVGKLDQKTQQVYSRLYLGSERVKHFTYKNDDKEFGRIRLKIGIQTHSRFNEVPRSIQTTLPCSPS